MLIFYIYARSYSYFIQYRNTHLSLSIYIYIYIAPVTERLDCALAVTSSRANTKTFTDVEGPSDFVRFRRAVKRQQFRTSLEQHQ